MQPTPIDRTFVQLLQQSVIGLSITSLLANYPTYRFWLEQVRSLAPQIWKAPQYFKYEVNYPYQNIFLRTHYDCLITTEQAAEIHYWQCSKPVQSHELLIEDSVQVALLVASRHLLYSPENIQLIYWFLQPDEVIPISIQYDQNSAAQFSVKLEKKCQELSLTACWRRGDISLIDYINAIPEVVI